MGLLKRKPRVLVLDDDASIQKLVSMILKREGYRVDVVDSGRKAIDALDRTSYAAIILDLMMPHEGGVTVLNHIRGREPELLKRVILLTATPESVLRAISKDVFAVVRKPFQTEDLVSALKRLA
ncbi:MAG TPA: response regulator [Thermoanaerobaculia bacterium]